MHKKIWLSPPHMSGLEMDFVQQAISDNWVAPVGPNIDGFEQEIASYIGQNKEVLAVNSGTSAIHLALIMAGVTTGDEVICPSFTFVATASPIVFIGATPIFVDSEQETWNMCPVVLERTIQDRISKGKKPKAIIAMHSYGMPFNVEKIQQIAKKHQILLIEDAASALGSTYKEQKCGTFGDYGIISFNGNKIITTSAGGVLISNSKKQKEKALYLATQAQDGVPQYQHSTIGYNYRMSNVVAGIGRGQLKVLEDRVLQRSANFEFYKRALSGLQGITFLDTPDGYFSNRWLTCMLTPSVEVREKIRLALAHENIESRPLWNPMHLQPIFKNCASYLNGVSEDLFNRGLCLPSGSNLTNGERERVVRCIVNLF